MYKIELLGVGPFVFRILNLKLTIWRNAIQLVPGVSETSRLTILAVSDSSHSQLLVLKDTYLLRLISERAGQDLGS